MRADEIRKAVKPYVPGWIAEQTATYTYPSGWYGVFGQFVPYNSGGTITPFTTMSVTAGSSFNTGVEFYKSTATSNDGDYFVCNIPLAAGTYSWRASYNRDTNAGKYDLYVDGTKITATPKDFYNASAGGNQPWDIDSIVIAADGLHEFKIVTNGKNGSSSDYVCRMSVVAIIKTG